MKTQGPALKNAVILGAGPAGLACADELSSHGIAVEILDKQSQVGGLCRTLDFEGYLFDVGGHRFLSRSTEVNAIWRSVLGDDLLERPRRSRIYYGGKFYDYPLKIWNALQQLGPAEAARCLASYVAAQMGKSSGKTASFEDWMSRRFGRRLYEIFFQTYTEKVWGVPGSRLSSDWAAQRIQQLSLMKALKQSLFGPRNGKIKTLSDKFYYPRRGPGQFCESLRRRCETRGVRFHLGAGINHIRHDGGRITEVSAASSGKGEILARGEKIFSSIPLPALIQRLDPLPPDEILEAAGSLRFRGFISVNLIFSEPHIFDDNWIYVHSPEVKAGRIQNYKHWSPEMVPDPGTTSLGVEYFVFSSDPLWALQEKELIHFALEELDRLGIVSREKFVKGFAVKVSHAYPVYESGYHETVSVLRRYLEKFDNLYLMGRAGLFRYNNSDHAMLTGLYAARNALGERHDIWSVDPDQAAVESDLESRSWF